MNSKETLANVEPKLLYKPSEEIIRASRMDAFRRRVNSKYGLHLEGYDQLWEWSVSNIEEFWSQVWDDTGIISSKKASRIIDTSKNMDDIPTWFEGAQLNFAENLLWKRDNSIAIISTGELRQPITITYKELYQQVKSLSAIFRNQGIIKGDRILFYGSNCPECIVTMLAASSIGAIFSSASADFGVKGILDRFSQIKAKILVSVNGVVYNGKLFNQIPKLIEIVNELDLETVVISEFISGSMDFKGIKNSISWNDYLNQGEKLSFEKEIIFEQLPFDHPLWILYSSGSTSKPKCITHRAGGMLIQSKKELVLHCDISEKDIFFFYTTTGWMMWNWLINGLSTGCQIILYDGSPFKPNPSSLWNLVDEFKITIFGTSPKYLQSLFDANYFPNKKHTLKSLRMLLSTGSPLKSDLFDYVYDNIRSRSQDNFILGSITGGTDICSLFCGMNVILPVYRGQIQCRTLGMKIEAWNGENNPVYDIPGDLVCTTHFPCQPIFFWNDLNNEKYRDAYFNHYSHIWFHGDFCLIDSKTNNGIIMLGRSDGTLNPSGIRFGSSEIYEIVDKFSQIQDSICVSQTFPSGEDERVILFIQLRQNEIWSDELIQNIKKSIRENLSTRHVPAKIVHVNEIPYTMNGKRFEVPVKKLINGTPIEKLNLSTMMNPNCLEEYIHRKELKFD